MHEDADVEVVAFADSSAAPAQSAHAIRISVPADLTTVESRVPEPMQGRDISPRSNSTGHVAGKT
jgi:hypothetical protein